MTTLCVLALSLFLSTAPANAAAPGTWFTESELAQKFDEVIFPFYQSMDAGVLRTKDGVLLNYRKKEVPNERGAIVLTAGYGQTHLQFAELMYGLNKLGYSVYMVDHRGLGFSSRLLPNTSKIYVGSFYDYVYDLKFFVNSVVKKSEHRHLILLAHSMGGQVAMIYQAMYPNDFKALVLNAPLAEMKAGNHTELGAYVRTRGAALALMGKKYAPGQGNPDWSKLGFENQTMSHSRARHAIKERLWKQFPYTRMGGATFRWVYTTIEASRWMRKHAPSKIHVPVLMLEADQDTIVVPAQAQDMCNRMSDCRRVFFPGSYHELFWETDDIRNAALEHVERFLEQHTK